MFAPFCPIHGSRVLLFADSIEALEKTPTGFDVHYRCNCGHIGVWHTERPD